MARNQKNFKPFTYVDDFGRSWNVRGEDGGALAAVDGHAAFDPTQPNWGRETARHRVRHAVYQDPVTFRTVRGIIYTHAAAAAIAPGDVVAVQVPGLATTVNYVFAGIEPERNKPAVVARNLADT